MGIGFQLGREKAKANFFDRDAVKKMMGERSRGFLASFGGWVRKTAQRSMRPGGKKRKHSAPGEPPRTQTGLLRKNIFFSFDPASRSVVVGPAQLNRGDDSPELLEHGGRATTEVFQRFRIEGGRLVFDPGRRRVEAQYQPRPYMQPAYQAGLARQDQFWRQSVRN